MRRGGLCRCRFCHAGRTFGVRLIRVSSPVRSAAATGPGTALRSPSTGGTNDGVTDLASRWMRSVSPPAHAGSRVGEMVWVGEFVDRSRPPVRQRPHDGVVDADETARRVGHQIAQAVGGHHRMVKRLNQIGGEPARHRQRDGRQHRRHAGIHSTDRHTSPPLACRAAICLQQIAIGGRFRAGDVIGAGGHLVGDRPRPRGSRGRRGWRSGPSGSSSTPVGNQHEAITDVTQHLERRRARTDDHRRAQPDHLRAAVDAQRRGDLRPAGEMLGQLVVLGHEPTEVDDSPHACDLGGRSDIGRGRRCRRRGSRAGRCRAPGSRRRRSVPTREMPSAPTPGRGRPMRRP